MNVVTYPWCILNASLVNSCLYKPRMRAGIGKYTGGERSKCIDCSKYALSEHFIGNMQILLL